MPSTTQTSLLTRAHLPSTGWVLTAESPVLLAVKTLPGGDEVPPGTGRLGNNADLTSTVEGQRFTQLPPNSTVRAYYLRNYARTILKKHNITKRLRWCGSKINRRVDGVGVYSRPDRAYGRVSGVCVCGQSLCCPVCAPRIAAFRASEVAEAFRRASVAGYAASLETFTIPHRAGSPLGVEIDCFGVAWKRFQSGRVAVARKVACLGNHVGREVTFGLVNGWNYHHHVLRYDLPGSYNPDLCRVQWLAALESVGRKWKGADEHAFDSGVIGDEAGARYCAKLAISVEAQHRALGSEIASLATKGRNITTLLASAAGGDQVAESFWLEGTKTIIHRKVSSVRWSRGLRVKLGIELEKSDEQVAAEKRLDTDILLGSLNPHQWSGILRWNAEMALLSAAQRGAEAVNEFLAGLELGCLDATPLVAVETSLKGDYAYAPFTALGLERKC